ncbi:MAG: CD1247 N-terminal domain-containing protein [Bacillota bacterium]|jgi:hypothetical protein
MALSEELAYLEGYIEGLEISEDTKEGKAIMAIIDLLEEIVGESVEMREDIDDLNTLGEELDEDLGQMEEFVFGDLCECGCEDDECCCDDDDDYEFGDIVYEEDDEEEEE